MKEKTAETLLDWVIGVMWCAVVVLCGVALAIAADIVLHWPE